MLSLQFDIVSAFFQNIFPKLGVALAILIVALILAGAFISDHKAYKWVFFSLGMAIFVFVMIFTATDWQFGGEWWLRQNWVQILVACFIIAMLAIVVLTSVKKAREESK